jgi:hypothetical protein
MRTTHPLKTENTTMPKSSRCLDIPVGRVEFMGQVLHIVEHEGRLVAVCNDEHGMPYEALSAARLDSRACRELMCEAVSLLLDAADLSLVLSAFTAHEGHHPQTPRAQRQTADARTHAPTSRRQRLHESFPTDN